MEVLQIKKKKNHEVLKREDREKGASIRHINKSEPIRRDWICVCVFGVWGGEKMERNEGWLPFC